MTDWRPTCEQTERALWLSTDALPLTRWSERIAFHWCNRKRLTIEQSRSSSSICSVAGCFSSYARQVLSKWVVRIDVDRELLFTLRWTDVLMMMWRDELTLWSLFISEKSVDQPEEADPLTKLYEWQDDQRTPRDTSISEHQWTTIRLSIQGRRTIRCTEINFIIDMTRKDVFSRPCSCLSVCFEKTRFQVTDGVASLNYMTK